MKTAVPIFGLLHIVLCMLISLQVGSLESWNAMLCDFDYFCANSSFIMDPSLQSAPVSAPFVEFVESEMNTWLRGQGK